VKAVVLVGGEGTRLRPLTFTTPKPLLPIANEAHLERQLAWLAAHGVTEVVLSMGYLPDAFHAHFRHDASGQDVFGDVTLRYAVESEPLGTAGAIRFAAEGIDERFVVCNGDVLTDLDLGAMVRFHDERGAQATISLTEVEDPSAFGVVPATDDGAVIAFVEKPAPGKAPSNWINAGTYIVEPEFLERVPPRLNVSVERETFPRMLEQPGLLFGFRSDAYWLDIGTPQKYLQAHDDVLGGCVGFPPARGAREVATGVWLQGDGAIEDGAVIEPPALIGDGARVEAGARVRRSVLGARAIVEMGAVLDRAVLHPGVRVSHGSSVINSVVGADAVLKPEVSLTGETIIGAGIMVTSGTSISGGRVPAERE
jgi:mannose-1-phosphate guanylyltransferase